MSDFVTRAEHAIVIPVHNGVRFTLRLLGRLRELEGPEVMVIVVDDGSSDGTADALAREHPDVMVLPGSGDLWWTGATNMGCRFAIQRGARWLLLLNNDDVVSRNIVVELHRVVTKTGGCASAVYVDSYDDGPKNLLPTCGTLEWKGKGVSMSTPPRPDELSPSDWLPGAALMFGADLYRELGGFDARRFPQYRGDIDFTLRARRSGRSCVVSCGCWVYNDPEQTWLDFRRRVSLRDFVRGFFTFKSDYNLRESLRFAARHCPAHLIPRYLFMHYGRWTYAFLKTNWRAVSSRGALRGS